MQQNQKYFALADRDGKLVPRFLVVSNVETRDPGAIIEGNERVLRARLADARFFFDQDRKTTLEPRVPRLASIVYHNKLGTQVERVARITRLAGEFAGLTTADRSASLRAAHLAKADLTTDMVGEFPELQGLMGYYYAQHDGEAITTANRELKRRPRRVFTSKTQYLFIVGYRFFHVSDRKVWRVAEQFSGLS
jgi:glycyl-tRNA synthetase beta chain